MKKILVVDDSATVRQQVSAALGPAGFEVVEAVDGIAGMDALARDPEIAAAICDVNMPRMNGIEMVSRVKRLPNNAKLAMIMLTTEGQTSLIREAKEAGALGWIVKPFKPAQLVAVIRKIFAWPPATGARTPS
jgi:two-component system chemotaxis response regulator CheY